MDLGPLEEQEALITAESTLSVLPALQPWLVGSAPHGRKMAVEGIFWSQYPRDGEDDRKFCFLRRPWKLSFMLCGPEPCQVPSAKLIPDKEGDIVIPSCFRIIRATLEQILRRPLPP